MVCPICIEEIENPFVLDCSHEFHENCINAWFKLSNGTCPFCRGIDDNWKIPIFSSSLMVAAQHGDIRRAKQLLAEGVEVDEEDFEGITALSYAITNRHFVLASSLLAAGADINHIDKKGTNILGRYASIPNSYEIIIFLLDNGIRTDMKDALGDTPLEIAAFSDNIEMLEILLDYGVRGLKSALNIAMARRSRRCAKALENYLNLSAL